MNNLKNRGRQAVVLTGVLLGAFALAACGGTPADDGAGSADGLIDKAACERNADAGTLTYISGYGYSASAGQLDVFIADELGYFDDLCLDVEINAAGGNGQQLVSSGKAQFTELGSAEDVLMAAANSRNITAVATYGTTSPFCIFANERIKSLKDLEGGTLGYFINLTPVAGAMLDAAGADESEIDMIKMTNYDPTVVLRGQVDAVVGYASNQCATLDAMGDAYSKFLPADFDIDGTYNVMEVNSEFLKAHPEAVSDFMRASLKALAHCLEDEADCIDRITELAEKNGQGKAFPREQQERTWAVESQWVRDSTVGAPGMQNAEQWQHAAGLVKEFGTAKTVPAIEDVINTEIVASLYDSSGELIWPGASK
ncbi:Hydroxymethylpyrimidine ABC transporter, substrate-binding component [Microbacterium esteraromaticum]|uniref:Thiamine pyrimidine synthase n=1 Tax=Microbacterium esteraromaticum TaxID=57043 RepID=A0A1R4INJ1_9MICO|nr:ABC transporter substrate-binding protein [Microbacterium esteraromaticum]SJN21426.1 Hydroxymethylpyrimidine ABC transporter, substrate-binding component [Microbacterium esteraromaticum]